MALAADDGVTRHVMVGFSDPAVPEGKGDGNQAEAAAVSQAAATAGRATAPATGALRTMAPRLALDAGDRMTPMRGVDTFLGALAIMVFAAIGAMLVHYGLHDSFGFGVGVFALAGAFMLYRIFSSSGRAARGVAMDAGYRVVYKFGALAPISYTTVRACSSVGNRESGQRRNSAAGASR
jgi:hypothetical protein